MDNKKNKQEQTPKKPGWQNIVCIDIYAPIPLDRVYTLTWVNGEMKIVSVEPLNPKA